MSTRGRETAIEDRLSRASEANYGGDREMFDLARDLVRCWREYLALRHSPLFFASTPAQEAIHDKVRALLAKAGDTP